MIESVFTQRNVSLKIRITAKTLIAAGLIVLAVALPQLFHVFAGASAGTTWLPMYMPVLLAGCILGSWWGLGVGILAPIVSFGFTSLALNSAMPALARLPFMVAELAIFGLVSGLFSKAVAKNVWIAFPAVLFAEVGGRVFFLILSAIFQSVSPLNPTLVWAQIQSGFIGLILWAVLAPLVVIALAKILIRTKEREAEHD